MRGEKRAVTVLIGIADQVSKRPIAGIVYRPFTNTGVVGIVGVGCWGYGYAGNSNGTFDQILDNIEKRRLNKNQRRIGTVTKIHFRPGMQKYIDSCKCESIVSAGGAGNKLLLIIEGEADVILFPQYGTKKWDTAAGEAIFLALNGKLTQPNGSLLEYNSEADHQNSDGFIATLFGDEYHESFLFPEFVSDYKKTT